jgi:peptidyl-prolyl cis-trans isomerase B (cyclophilin B)
MKKTAILFTLLAAFALQGMSQQANNMKFVIHTDYGDIHGVLYNDTPQHRDNFIKLVNEGWYNGSIFHRVIKDFMIQGGQNADGRQDPGYTVPAEFRANHFHKKGALAAARMPDQMNPEKASSGSQFYIVHGRVFDEAMLTNMAQGGKSFTDEQRQIYSTTGGTPHLDGDYTVFGEITDGLDVVDKIAVVKTGGGDRPVNEVKMTVEIEK